MGDLKAKSLWPAMAGILLGAAVAWSQGYITTVEDSAFENRMRPVVSFEHDRHNQAAGIDSCSTCHHVYEDGRKLPGQVSIGMECSACHLSGSNGRLELIRAYHLQCKSCHLEKGAGPVQCAQCHRRHAEGGK